MKSQQQESNIQTNCKNCVFKIEQDGEQTGCKAGRLKTFLDRGEAGKLGSYLDYKIFRLCNLYRDDTWRYKDSQDSLQVAKEEVKTKFCIIIFDDPKNSQLEQAVESIYNLDYPQDKIQVVISSYHQENVTHLVTITNQLSEKFKHSKLVLNWYHNNKSLIEYDAFSKCVYNGFFVKMNHNDTLPKHLLRTVDDSINNKLEKTAIFAYRDIPLIPRAVVSNQYLNYNDFDLMARGVIQEAKQQNLFQYIDEK